jgi:dephospho-CoA kinase
MGKTTISNYLANTYHLPVLDADVYARAAVEPGSQGLAAIVHRYGSDILQADGTLNRSRLGEIVFQNPQERIWLEQQIHPIVRDRFATELAARSDQPIVVLVVPLLFEARMTDQVSEIWVVYSSLEQQRQRLMQRDRLTADQAQARIDSQMPIAEKMAQADVVLDNSTTQAALFQQIDAALRMANLIKPET